MSGEVLQPVADLPRLDELPEPPPDRARDVLDRLVIIKLNGGLGTSMGLAGPKSLLEVKPGMNFLDVLARQVLALRERYRARLPLVLMNSAATRGPSLAALARRFSSYSVSYCSNSLKLLDHHGRTDGLPAKRTPTRGPTGIRPKPAIGGRRGCRAREHPAVAG